MMTTTQIPTASVPSVGEIVKALDGRLYTVEAVESVGENLRKVKPMVSHMLALVPAKRPQNARTWAADFYTDGRIQVLCAL